MALYLIAHETNLFGTWSTPEEAVKNHFAYEIQHEGLDIDNKVTKMLAPHSDYPYLIKLKAGQKFIMDR
jgi:hypothetical protein